MQILFFCPRWGQEASSWKDFFRKVKDAGYDGVECSLPFDEPEKEEVLYGLQKHELKWIAQHWETVVKDFGQHCAESEKRLRHLASGNPLFINTQTGKDYYSFEQNKKLIEIAAQIAQETGVPVVHETHRGKFTFAAHITQVYLEQLPELKITLDVSHWCSTAETFLHDQPEALAIAIERAAHIHARVGYTEGPQVSDPRAPEWKEALDFHLHCWDRIIERRRKNNADVFTITPEFGAPPYLPLLPYTRQPIASQWEINCYMMHLLRTRYGKVNNESSVSASIEPDVVEKITG